MFRTKPEALADHQTAEVYRRQGVEGRGFICQHACDILPESFALARAWAESGVPDGPQCFFDNMLTRLGARVNAQLELKAPPDRWWQFDNYSQNRIEILHDLKQCAEIVQLLPKQIFTAENMQECKIHGHRCKVCDWGDLPKEVFRTVSGGCSCVPHSSKGPQVGLAHKSLLELICFCEEINTMGADGVFVECTKGLPMEIL